MHEPRSHRIGWNMNMIWNLLDLSITWQQNLAHKGRLVLSLEVCLLFSYDIYVPGDLLWWWRIHNYGIQTSCLSNKRTPDKRRCWNPCHCVLCCRIYIASFFFCLYYFLYTFPMKYVITISSFWLLFTAGLYFRLSDTTIISNRR